MHSPLQQAPPCCLPSTLQGVLPSLLSLEPQVGVARAAWGFDIVGICPQHDIRLGLAFLAFPEILPSFQGNPGFSLLSRVSA